MFCYKWVREIVFLHYYCRMKTTLITAFLLSSLTSYCQEWTKHYTTTTGIEISVGDKFRISNKALNDIWPKHNPERMRMDAAERLIKTEFPGTTQTIVRLSRVPKGNGYKEVAIFEIMDKQINRLLKQEYYVDIEQALKDGEIIIEKAEDKSAN